MGSSIQRAPLRSCIQLGQSRVRLQMWPRRFYSFPHRIKGEAFDIVVSSLHNGGSFAISNRSKLGISEANVTQSAITRRNGEGTNTDIDMIIQPEPIEPDYLQQLIESHNPEVLEAGVGIGLKLLDQLKSILEQGRGREDFEPWLKSIEYLQSRTQPPRSIIGVVGNTGAGKSSIINALLDEDR